MRFAFTPSWRRSTVQVIKKETQISGKNYASWNARRRSYHRLRQCQPQILCYILICSFVYVVAEMQHFSNHSEANYSYRFQVFHTYINLMIINFYQQLSKFDYFFNKKLSIIRRYGVVITLHDGVCFYAILEALHSTSH